jgi:S-adenosylmethionine:tRNA ribosyltransferase-isomerase
MELVKPYGSDGRLWVARVTWPEPAIEWLTAHARPIRYDYVERAWPLATYQNVYATEYGSAEMPSAGRPFTSDVITRLVAMGVEIAPLILHCGVASLEDGERPYPERVKVSALTSERVNAARRDNRRVLAVGTTVVRALEASLGSDGHAHPYDGWTDVVVSPDSPTHLIDGLLSGWHEPVSSHLLMLEAIAGRELLENSYRTALSQDFHWHEFGDLHLILP